MNGLNDNELTGLDTARLDEEEEALRSLSPTETALGHNASDYHNMTALYRQIIERVSAMNDDPRAFVTKSGAYDVKALGVWKSLAGEARQMLQGLNAMRNSDKMTSHILEQHTREFSQAVAVNLGQALSQIIMSLDQSDRDEIKQELLRFVSQRMPAIFASAGRSTLSASKEEFGLLH